MDSRIISQVSVNLFQIQLPLDSDILLLFSLLFSSFSSFRCHSFFSFFFSYFFQATNLFGEGLYFSTDLEVSASFSKGNRGWGRSVYGERAAFVLLAEVIRHPTVRSKTNPGRFDTSFPDSYLVVQSNEHVKVRHILVFSENKFLGLGGPVAGFLTRHLFKLLVALYLLLLLFVAWQRHQR